MVGSYRMSKHFSVPFPFQHFSHLVRIKKESSNKWNSFGCLIMIFDHPLSPIVIQYISPKTNSNKTCTPFKKKTPATPRPYPPQGTPGPSGPVGAAQLRHPNTFQRFRENRCGTWHRKLIKRAYLGGFVGVVESSNGGVNGVIPKKSGGRQTIHTFGGLKPNWKKRLAFWGNENARKRKKNLLLFF